MHASVGSAVVASRARCVLIVDDDDAIRTVLAAALRAEGYEVAVAPHGADALSLAASHPPDVILLDYQMPVMDGPTFAKRFRAARRARAAPPVPIILMTATADAVQRCREVQADGCLPKPFDLEDLLHALEQPRHQHTPTAA